MSLQIPKIKTYIGFAIKSREIKFGVDDIVKTKNPKLVLASKGLGESSLSKLKKFLDSKNMEVTLLDDADFAEIIQSENIKAVSIENNNLAEAIKKNLTNF